MFEVLQSDLPDSNNLFPIFPNRPTWLGAFSFPEFPLSKLKYLCVSEDNQAGRNPNLATNKLSVLSGYHLEQMQLTGKKEKGSSFLQIYEQWQSWSRFRLQFVGKGSHILPLRSFTTVPIFFSLFDLSTKIVFAVVGNIYYQSASNSAFSNIPSSTFAAALWEDLHL